MLDLVDINWRNDEKQLGSYYLKKELSNSMWSVIYLAQDFKQEFRQVILKCLKTRLKKYAQQVFLFEARWSLLARAQHKHIVTLLDIGVKDDCAYFVVEYMSGGSLRDRLQQQTGQPLPWHETRNIFQQIGSALSAAHNNMSMPHGGLKPERILFNEAGEASVGYFALDKVHQFSQNVVPYWTFPYAAPEHGILFTDADDQHALGCILYEMCTGHQPWIAPGEPVPAMYLREHSEAPYTFNENFLKSYTKFLNEPPASPRSLNPALSVKIERVILKAIARNPDDRYHSIDAFVTAILQVE